jgi:hypothetical protein
MRAVDPLQPAGADEVGTLERTDVGELYEAVGTVVSADGSEVVLDLRERRVVVLVAGLPAATLDPGDPVRARGPLVG